jgi:branched-chain amino acid transport system substrate-binding protein
VKRYLLLVAALFLISAMVLTGCAKSTNTSTSAPASTTAASTTPVPTTSSAAPAKTLKIGVLTDLSGFLSVFYLEGEKDLEITANYINDHGGITIQGQKYNIEIVARDSKSSPDGALASANQLIFQDQVKYVIGPISFEGVATSPLFEQNKILHIFSFTSTAPQEIGPSTPYAFTGDNSALDFGRAIFMIGKKQFPNAKTCVILLPDDGTAQYVVPKMLPVLQSLGYTVLNNGQGILFPNDMQDFSPIVSKLNSLNPDIVFQSSTNPASGYGILKGMRSLGMTTAYVNTLFPGDMNNVITAVGADAATNFACTNYTTDDPNNPPMLKELIAKLPPNTPFFTFTLGNSLTVLLQVMKQADSLDADAIKAKWESLDTIPNCIYGTGTVGGDQSYGLHHHSVSFPIPYNKLMNGKIATIEGSDWLELGPTP